MADANAPEPIRRIHEAVDRNESRTVELLQRFVRTRSITGGEAAMGAVVADAFSSRGLKVERWAATPDEIRDYLEHVGDQPSWEGRLNVTGRRAGAGNGRSILLNAHIDT